jgi:Flp pilus assembly protein TadD
MWAGRWPDAVPLLEGLLRMAPEHAEVRVGDACLRVIPEDGAIRHELARCLIESGRLNEARAALEGEDNPPDGDGCVLLAWIAAQQGHPALAVMHLETAGRLDPAAWSTALGCPGLAALVASLN